MPGYFTTIANSPGSLEPKIVNDLELESYGLKWVRPDPTLVQPLDGGGIYVGWRDPKRNHAQIEAFAKGEAARYDALFQVLPGFRRSAGHLALRTAAFPAVSGAQPDAARGSGSLQPHPVRQRPRPDGRIRIGATRHRRSSHRWRSLAGRSALPAPGSPFNLLMRPLSLASVRCRFRARSATHAVAWIDGASGRRHGRHHRRDASRAEEEWRPGAPGGTRSNSSASATAGFGRRDHERGRIRCADRRSRRSIRESTVTLLERYRGLG